MILNRKTLLNYLDKVTWITPEAQEKANQAPLLFVLEEYQKPLGSKAEVRTLEDTNLSKTIEIKHWSCDNSLKFLFQKALLFRCIAYDSIQCYSSLVSGAWKGAYVFLHTLNTDLNEFLRCSMSNAMIKHFVQKSPEGLKSCPDSPFFCKTTNFKRIAWVSSKNRVFLAGWYFIGLARSQCKSNPVLLFRCSDILQ